MVFKEYKYGYCLNPEINSDQTPSESKLQITNYFFALLVLNFALALQFVNLGLIDNCLKA